MHYNLAFFIFNLNQSLSHCTIIKKSNLEINVVNSGYSTSMLLTVIAVYGTENVSKVAINGQDFKNFTYLDKVLSIQGTNIDMLALPTVQVTWS